MFYYPTVLRHRSGCFSTIWLAATRGIKITSRDILTVNVKRTCDDIMNYVLERVPPPFPDLPQPRFSLYLSSQLQYGVIVVYHRQCVILLNELHSIVMRMLRQKKSEKIDLDDQTKKAQLLPDALSLMMETDGALDPMFGAMYTEDTMPSPSALIRISEDYLREASPVPPKQHSPPAAVAEAVAESRITSSPDRITLRDPEPVTICTAEFEGEELVDQFQDTVDILMAQDDYFAREEDLPPLEQVRETARAQIDEELERDKTREVTVSTAEVQPPTLPSEELTLLPQDKLDVTEERPQGSLDLTPPSEPILRSPVPVQKEHERPSSDLAELPPRVVQRRKRQLIFFDPETQIPQEELQRQINNPLTETRRPPPPPPPSFRTAADLFHNPCSNLPEDVLSLWQQAATIMPVSGSDLQAGERGPESSDSVEERDRGVEDMVQVTEREAERHELSPKDVGRSVQRGLTEAEVLDMSGLGPVSLEASDQKELSREISPMYLSDKEGSAVSRSVSTLQDIPDVVDEFLEKLAAIPELLLDEPQSTPVLFPSLLPPKANRQTVSTIFQKLLEIVSAKKLRVEQQEPYGDILILFGPGSTEEFFNTFTTD